MRRLPVKSVADLKAYGVANPNKLALGSSGGLQDLASPLLSEALGHKNQGYVPFDGVAPGLTALLAGDVQTGVLARQAAARAGLPRWNPAQVKMDCRRVAAKRDPVAGADHADRCGKRSARL